MIRAFGEHALLVEVDDAARAQALAASLADARVPGVVAAVPGLASVLVELEPSLAGEPIAEVLAERMAALKPESVVGRTRTIPVLYGGERGPDLDEVAAARGMTPDEYAARHAATDLHVLFCGFAPGFAYLGELPEDLRVPRLRTPRTQTPAGSVAVAGSMTGIYPADLPGGWRVIGWTPLTLFDPHRESPTYLAPGDLVRWRPVDVPGEPRAADDW